MSLGEVWLLYGDWGSGSLRPQTSQGCFQLGPGCAVRWWWSRRMMTRGRRRGVQRRT